MDYCSLSKVGSREINEDNVGIFHKNDYSLFVVADGLGGHSKGEVASKIAINTAKELLECNKPDKAFYNNYFSECSKRLIHEQDIENNPNAIKTTVVMALYTEGVMEIAHVGDSRLYYFHNNKLVKRTLDHSVPQMLVLAGAIPERKIRNHPDRNKLLKVIGERQILSDPPKIYETEKFEQLSSNDAFLLCSDGFWELIKEREMEKTLKHSADSSEWLHAMEDILLKHGRHKEMDNYSAICIIL